MIRCIYSPSTDIYFHLAAEEYLLKQGNEDVFMLWQDTPSVVIGKHQRLQAEVDREWVERKRIHIARRFSGGGAVYHDLGNVNLTFIETVSRLPDFSLYLHRILDFLKLMGIMAKGDDRLGIYLNGLKISGSAQYVHKNRVLYHCTLLYDTDLTILNKVLNPDVIAHDGTLSSVYALWQQNCEPFISCSIWTTAWICSVCSDKILRLQPVHGTWQRTQRKRYLCDCRVSGTGGYRIL